MSCGLDTFTLSGRRSPPFPYILIVLGSMLLRLIPALSKNCFVILYIPSLIPALLSLTSILYQSPVLSLLFSTGAFFWFTKAGFIQFKAIFEFIAMSLSNSISVLVRRLLRYNGE